MDNESETKILYEHRLWSLWSMSGVLNGKVAHSRRAARKCRCRSRGPQAGARAAAVPTRTKAEAPASACRSTASR